MHQQELIIETSGRGTVNITSKISHIVDKANITSGLCHIFIKHTSASLILCENADPDVHQDLENFMARLVPDGDKLFIHTAEGQDDMPAHIRSVLTQSFLTIPVRDGQLDLGTWQGIYLWEHRYHAYTRRLTITLS